MPLYPPASSGSGAPTDAQYVTLATNGTLSAERVLTPAGHMAGADAGAGSTYTITGLDEANLLINGGFDIAQRVDPTATTTVTNDAYCHFDRWYTLRQGANATITRIAGTDGSKFTCKLVSGGTTNRFGIAQIVESYASIPMRGRSIRFQCRIRANKNAGAGSIDVRCAVLEWTGGEDSVTTSDVVGDWTSSDYTVGAAKFFANTTYTLVSTAQISAAHNTWTDLAITGTVSSSCANLVVFVWAEDAPAHASDFIEVGKAGLYDGATARPWIPRPIRQEFVLCRRYCRKSFNPEIAPAQATGSYVGAVAISGTVATTTDVTVDFESPMLTTPTVTTYNPTQANANWRNGGNTADATASLPFTAGHSRIPLRAAVTGTAAAFWIHYLAEAEL